MQRKTLQAISYDTPVPEGPIVCFSDCIGKRYLKKKFE